MAFCQRCCNWVFQPPTQLRQGGIYSRWLETGLFPAMTAVWLWPGLALRTRRSCGRAADQQRQGGDVHRGEAAWGAGMRGMSQRTFGEAAVPDCLGLPPSTWKSAPAALGLGPAWLGSQGTADVAERTENTGPRILCAPRRIYLGDRRGEPVPHGQNRRLPRSE